nr:hypothetical protein [Tanacetum cinerariifolium]
MADAKLARSASMSSSIDLVCSGGDDIAVGSGDGDTDNGSGGEGDLDLLRDKDSKSDGGAGLTWGGNMKMCGTRCQPVTSKSDMAIELSILDLSPANRRTLLILNTYHQPGALP